MTLRRLFSTIGIAAIGAIAALPVWAQGLNFNSGGGQPIEILANEGIEWHRETQRYVARGNASARQGETTVYGDTLTAYYRTQPGGGTEIFRYEAVGRVRIATPTQNAVGDKGVYDLDTGVLVLTGSNLRFTTPSDTITARDSMEFWDAKKVAVARGNAVAISQERRMTGDILTAHFVEGKAPPPPPAARNSGRPGAPPARQQPAARGQTAAPAPAAARSDSGTRLQRIEGFGNVHVSTATDIVRGDKGVYNADSGIAMMSGAVRITRGQNQLNGDFAEVNLNTGISRLLTRQDGSGDNRVRGVFVPDKQQPGAAPGQSRPNERQGTR